MKPICVKCSRFYKPKKNGKWFIEGMPKSNHAPPGVGFPELWTPYKLWTGDLWECPECGNEIIVGVPQVPISEHYEPEFAELSKRADYQVNDC